MPLSRILSLVTCRSTKACFFAWAATKGKIPTWICLKQETLTGLLGVLCVLKRKRWWTTSLFIVVGFHHSGICLLMGVRWVQPFSRCPGGVEKKNEESRVGSNSNIIPLAIWWCAWKERNSRIFDGKALSFARLEAPIFKNLT